ncbi:MAG: O-antigen ligase family protein [Dermatophilaceae bacterium]
MNPHSDPSAPPPRTILTTILARYPIAQNALVAIPALAAAGPYASLRPGSSGFPYLYRVLWALLAIVAVPLFFTRQVRTRLLPRLFTLFVAWWAIWTPITLLWSPAGDVGRTQILASTASLVGAWVVLITTRGTARSLHLLRIGFVIAVAMNVAVVLWEWFSGEHLVVIAGIQDWYYSAYLVAGTFTNPNGLSNFLIVAVAVLTAQLIRERAAARPRRAGADAVEGVEGPAIRGSRPRVVALVIALACCVVVIGLTGSRGGMIASTVVLLGGALWCFPGRIRATVPIALVLLAAGGPLLALTDYEKVRPSSASAGMVGEEPSSGRHLDNLTRDQVQADLLAADRLRVDLSRSGLRSFAEAPLQGHGAGAAITTLEQDPQYGPGLDPALRRIINLHNTFLEVAVNYGVIGLAPIILLLGGILTTVLRPGPLRRLWPDPNVFETLAVLLGVAVTSIIASTALGDPTFWLSLAYAAAVAWNYADAVRADAAGEEVSQT